MIALREKFSITIFYLAIFALLSYGYVYFVVDLFGYAGYTYAENIPNFLFSTLIVITLAVLTPSRINKKFSTLYFHLSLLLIIAPMATLCAFGDKSLLYLVQTSAAYLLTLVLTKALPLTNFKFKSVPYNNFALLLLIASCLIMVLVALIGGISHFNLDISRVYEFRADAADNLPDIFAYLLPVIGKVALPLALVIFLKEKKYIFAVIAIICSFILFGLTAHKSNAFFAILMLFIYWLLSMKNVIIKLQTATVFILILSIVGTLVDLGTFSDQGLMIGSLFLRRSFIVPADLNFAYFDFFNSNPFVFWSNSRLSFGLLDYEYGFDLAKLIGGYRFNKFETSANTGWAGSGYAHAGFFGMLLYSAIIAAILALIDTIAYYAEDAKLVIAAATIPMITIITSSDLPTAMLTHGVLFSIFLMLLLQRRNA